MNCKFCDSKNVIKYGKYGGIQLYFCKDCGSKFKGDDTTFHMKTPANQVTSALNMWYEGMSIASIRRNLQQEHGNIPSTATIYEWIQKYTQYATDSIKGHKPTKIGDTWVADETVIEIDGNNVWLWDIIDYDTRFLLATRISRSRTTQDAQMLYDKAVKMAGKEPEKVITDKLASYLDVRYGKDTDHIRSSPFAVEHNTQLIERFHSTLKQRTKVMRGLKNIQSAIDFMDGFFVHYNYLRPHESLKDKTPAEVAKIATFPYKSWLDVIKSQIPKPPPKPKRKLTLEEMKHPFKNYRKRPKPKKKKTMRGKILPSASVVRV